MTGMIGHHRRRSHGGMGSVPRGRPAVQRLAERIDQRPTGRDRQHAPVAGRPGISDRSMHAHDAHARNADRRRRCEELDRARGTAFDSLFLTGMIQHHRGAVRWSAGSSRPRAPRRTRPCSSSPTTSGSIRPPRSPAWRDARHPHRRESTSVNTRADASVMFAFGLLAAAAAAAARSAPGGLPSPEPDMSTTPPSPDPRVGLKAGLLRCRPGGVEHAGRLEYPDARRSSPGSRTRTSPSPASTRSRGTTTATRCGTSRIPGSRRSPRATSVPARRATCRCTGTCSSSRARI